MLNSLLTQHNQINTVASFRMEYVSLGSNCSVTWWLNKLKLRKRAYPFDWANITIQQLNNVLNNKFDEYIDSLAVKFISDKYLDTDGKSTALIINSYGVKFAHEMLTDNINEFKKSLINRVVRFNNLSEKDFIVYVRIELKPISSKYTDYLKKLIKLFDSINEKYVIKIIIHKDSNIKISLDKVKIYYYDSFSPDWKMERLDWTNILCHDDNLTF